MHQKILHALQTILLPRNKQQLLQLLGKAQQQHVVSNETLKMLEGVMKIDHQKVRDIMIPRAQMIVLSKGQTVKEALANIKESKHSRFPVIGKDRDEFTGLILAKDLLVVDKSTCIDGLCRPIACVSEDKRVSHLLREFQVHHTHLAIVADEFGAISGLVTLEDITEEIIGEIEDEHYNEQNGQNPIKSISAHKHLIQGQTHLDEINKTLNLKLPTDDFDTLGGLVAFHAGGIPQKGQCIQIGNLSCTIEKASVRKIESILLEELT